MKRKITAIYYRVSKKSKNNLQMQRKICREYCSTNKITHIREYRDIGFSGLIKNRPAMIDLLRDVSTGNINQILVYKIDRLGRNFSYLNSLCEDLNKMDVKITSVTQDFDFSTPEGKFLFRLLMMLSEFESGMISRRTLDGLRAKNH